ncbi:MAG: hypothetical protein RL167_737 [Actinomycetota bacterium]|jgi:nucleoside-diphosphate-sugar epimerase
MKLVVGAGLIGQEVAKQLLAKGEDVVVASRSGTQISGAKAIKLDAKNPADFQKASSGASTIFLCTNPPYHTWATEWPPVFEAAVAAAQTNECDLVVMGNLYSYGLPSGEMNEHSDEKTTEAKGLIRKQGWRRLLNASQAGQFKVVEVRASDYFGPGAGSTAHIGRDFFEPIMKSKNAMVVGNPNALHSWSYLPDIALTLIAASEFHGPWSRAWHVPSTTKTRNQILNEINAATNSKGKLFAVPQLMLRTMGLFSPLYREVFASSYQFTNDFVIDSRETEALLKVEATPWDLALEQTINSYSNL